jgi:hypothetical protein
MADEQRIDEPTDEEREAKLEDMEVSEEGAEDIKGGSEPPELMGKRR